MNIGDHQIQQIEDRIEELETINAELLAACKRVMIHGANEWEAEDILRAVIAKAEGRE